ncbi:MAG TPA: TMEM175 family protein [Rubrivivax sp.]|nr:TMEM175 family protein [Rubrivivax sp.]
MKTPQPAAVAISIGKARLEALSDGVYAVALTLLALDLKLALDPGGSAGPSNAVLASALVAMVPKALVWLLSFWVASLFWLAQNRMLQQYGQLDRRGLAIELAQLALVTLLPFSTALISTHGDRVVGALTYSVHLVMMAMLSMARIRRVQRHPVLRAAAFDALAVQAQWRRASVWLGCLVACAMLALVAPGWNMLAALGILFDRPGSRR